MAVDWRQASREMRDLLWEWDIIGIRRPAAAEDEYDCLIAPLFDRLRNGDDNESVERFLRSHIPAHFGIACPPSVVVFVDKLKRWWDSADSPTDETDVDPLVAFEIAEDVWWLEGSLDSDRLPEVAVNALLGGLDSPSLRALAGASPRDVRDNRDLWEKAMRELGRELPFVDPLARKVWRLLDAISAGRLEACRGAHRLNWLVSQAWERSEGTEIVDQPWLTQELIGFVEDADECERHTLDDRDDIREAIVARATEMKARIEAVYLAGE